ncbi:MAG: CBS domain-containing protein [Roseococcus sp.]|nr:CBS domain-containing protein [Roseococcus sp.]
MTVAAVLRQKGASVISVPPVSTVAEAAEIISRRRISAVVVCDEEGRLVGILSERDVESLTAYVMGRGYALGRV